MRRVTTVLCAAAILVLAAGTAPTWAGYASLNNFANLANSIDTPPYTTASPTVTTGGALWINTGSGPTPLDIDVNMEFLASTTQNGTFADLQQIGIDGQTNGMVSLFLLSIPQGQLQSAIGWNPIPSYPVGPGNPNNSNGYQGCFYDPAGANWGIPGTDSYSVWAYVKIRAWTGNFNSYAAAVAGGAYVAESTAFSTHFAAGIDPTIGDCAPMPAMILSHVPEPSTLILLAASLAGLLAYAWRKRRQSRRDDLGGMTSDRTSSGVGSKGFRDDARSAFA